MWGLWTATHSYLIKLAVWPPFISAMDGDDEDDSSGREKGDEHARAQLFFLPKPRLCLRVGNTEREPPKLLLLLPWGRKPCTCWVSQKQDSGVCDSQGRCSPP